MQTKEYLSQIRKFERMIKNKLLEIEELETNACSITVATDNEKIKSSGAKDKIGILGGMAADLQNEIAEIAKKRKVIVKQIDSIEDVAYYDILTMYFVLGMDIQRIADERDCGIDNVKRIKRSAMMRFEEKFGAEYL